MSKKRILLFVAILTCIFLYSSLSTHKCSTIFSIHTVHDKLSKDYTWRYEIQTSYSMAPKGIENIWKYDIQENYPKNLDFLIKYKPKTCKITTSYQGKVRCGVTISACSRYWKHLDKIETNIFIRDIKNNQSHGRSLFYGDDGKIKSISSYDTGKKEGMDIQFDFDKPSFLQIFHDGKFIGGISFLFPGHFPHLNYEFENQFDKNKKNDVYNNGQICFEEIEELGIDYWVFYNINGSVILKWPKDNNFCNAKFYSSEKEEKITFYFNRIKYLNIYHNNSVEQIKNPQTAF